MINEWLIRFDQVTTLRRSICVGIHSVDARSKETVTLPFLVYKFVKSMRKV